MLSKFNKVYNLMMEDTTLDGSEASPNTNESEKMTEVEIIRAWNEKAEAENHVDATIMDKFEFEDYIQTMEAAKLNKLILNMKNFNSNDRYFFMDGLGFWRSFNSIQDDICPIDMDELKEYLENK